MSAGLSQGDLERATGIPKSRLSRYENDHILPSIVTLRRLARALALPESALIDDNGDPWQAFVRTLKAAGISFESDADAVDVAWKLMNTEALRSRAGEAVGDA
jgi:transcriptional regulator with XRE-family HTH domain